MSPFADVAELEAALRALDSVPCENGGFSELEHGLQCAEILRAEAPDDLELQVAGLLHDVGAQGVPEAEHGVEGARLVQPLLGERVADLVRLHVGAKRYAVTRDRAYRERLSPVSLATLALQGGPMSEAEAAAFEAEPHGRDALRLRGADDRAKVPGARTAELAAWTPALRRLAQAR